MEYKYRIFTTLCPLYCFGDPSGFMTYLRIRVSFPGMALFHMLWSAIGSSRTTWSSMIMSPFPLSHLVLRRVLLSFRNVLYTGSGKNTAFSCVSSGLEKKECRSEPLRLQRVVGQRSAQAAPQRSASVRVVSIVPAPALPWRGHDGNHLAVAGERGAAQLLRQRCVRSVYFVLSNALSLSCLRFSYVCCGFGKIYYGCVVCMLRS